MAIKTGRIYHPDYHKHQTGNHPENARRLEVIVEILQQTGIWSRLVEIPPFLAEIEQLARAHSLPYIQIVESLCRQGGGYLDPDTVVSPASFEVACLAAGGVLAAAEAVWEGGVQNALALIRPPGHHACPDRGMGFCIFNNVAVAIRHLQSKHRLKKIFIVDWDVHHGNGLQEIFYSDPRVFYFSFHQYPHYPGTGRASETGSGEGTGYTCNFPLPAGTGTTQYLNLAKNELLPRIEKFLPEIIFISAGFDAHVADPLGGMRLSVAGYESLTDMIMEVAEKVCGGKIVSVLEGGYHLKFLPYCILGHLRSLAGLKVEIPEQIYHYGD